LLLLLLLRLSLRLLRCLWCLVLLLPRHLSSRLRLRRRRTWTMCPPRPIITRARRNLSAVGIVARVVRVRFGFGLGLGLGLGTTTTTTTTTRSRRMGVGRASR